MSQRKKKKGDESHPFAGYLTADEKILWIDRKHTSTPPNSLKNYGYLAFASLIVWVLLLSTFAPASVIVSTSLMCTVLILIPASLVAFRPVQKAQSPSEDTYVYALTNKHLFYRFPEGVTEVALEHVPPIRLEPGVGSQGTLSFGVNFPVLPDINDAAYVKTMIELAQKERLKEINA